MDTEFLGQIATRWVERVKAAGATDAEAVVVRDESRGLEFRDGAVEGRESAVGRRIYLRAYDGLRTAAISLSLDDREAAEEKDIAARVTTMAKASPEDPFVGLAPKGDISQDAPMDFDQFDPADMETPEAMETRARSVYDGARSVGNIREVDAVSVGAARFGMAFAASNGILQSHAYSQAYQSAVVLAGDEGGLSREYAAKSKVYTQDLEAPEHTGIRAAERARDGAGAVRPKSGRFPILFDERISGSLIGHALAAMNGNAVAREQSWLLEKLGEPLFRESINVIETPHRLRRSSSRQFDGDGYATREWHIIEAGRPTHWITNLTSAAQLGIQTNRNATRSGTSTSAGIPSLRLDGDNIARETLLRDMHEGLVVTGFIGATINPNTGDYSRGVNGFWVRDGQIAEPVHEAVIAGNLIDMFATLRSADDGDDEKSHIIPSLLVTEMTLAGT